MSWTLACLALGSFAIGTQGLSTTVLVPLIAADLAVSLPVAGQLVTVFALVYAVGSPVLTAVFAGAERRRLLLWSMAGIVVTNVAAAAAPDFKTLLAARVGIALASGLFIAVALAFAAAAAPRGRSGRALSIVGLGVPVSMIVGVPLATRLAGDISWRAALVLVAGCGAVALAGMSLALGSAGRATTVSLKDRIRVARDRAVLRALSATVLWSAASYCVLPFLAAVLAEQAGIDRHALSYVMLGSGVAGALGMWLGGRASDRVGPDRVRTVSTACLCVALLGIAVAVQLPSGAAAIAVMPAIALWGCAAWAFQPPQQAKVVALASAAAPVALSLNQSALSIGAALGAGVGSAVVALASPAMVGWPAAGFALVACGLCGRGPAAQDITGGLAPMGRA
jgi:predicted MFS family arabinose efflux permease